MLVQTFKNRTNGKIVELTYHEFLNFIHNVEPTPPHDEFNCLLCQIIRANKLPTHVTITKVNYPWINPWASLERTR